MSNFTLIHKASYKPDKPNLFVNPTIEQVTSEFLRLQDCNPMAYDIETTGLNCFEDTIVCVGITTSKGSVCFDTRDEEVLDALLVLMLTEKLFAANSVFDHSFLEVWARKYYEEIKLGLHVNSFGDVLVMFKLLANEGWTGQRWNVETLVEHVIGWPVNNKTTLKDMLDKHGLNKATMSKLMETEDIEGFMYYCQLDSLAAYQGMTHLRSEARKRNLDMVIDVHDMLFNNLIELVIEQKMEGIPVDLPEAYELKETLELQLETIGSRFRNHTSIAPLLTKFKTLTDEEWKPAVIKERKVWAKKSDKPWEDSSWIKGEKKKLAKWEQKHGGPWYKFIKVSVQPKKPLEFNIGSGEQLRWLFYVNGLVDYAITQPFNPDGDKPWNTLGQVEIYIEHEGVGQVANLTTTDKGLLPTDKNALTFFGEAGKILKDYNKVQTLLQYVNSLIAVTDPITHLWHPELRVHATITNRSGGGSESAHLKGKLSPQILPKDERFLKLLLARPNSKLLSCDFTSLENVVLAELSRDKGLNIIYGKGSVQDGYLYPAIINDPMGAEINKVYNIDNPTKESVDEAKKQFKSIRDVWKILVLMTNYNAGPEKKRRAMQQDMIFKSIDEVKESHYKYLKGMSGVSEWEDRLKSEWNINGGYVKNGFNLPMCVPEYLLKDVKNRVCQSTGHLIHLLFLYYQNKLRKERNVNMVPYQVDWHDDGWWTSDQPEKSQQIMVDAMIKVNEWLKGSIPMTGEPTIGDNVYEIK